MLGGEGWVDFVTGCGEGIGEWDDLVAESGGGRAAW